MSRKGAIFKISSYSLHDGPGIRTTVFMKGCPARCLWCCSPESQSFEREIAVNTSTCVACGRCAAVCPKGALSCAFGGTAVDRSKCDLCGNCVVACPKDAIEIVGTELTPQELFDLVRKDEPFWRRSGGGVTLSGGEVLAQPDFAIAFLDLCRSRGIHTAIETCLFADTRTTAEVAKRADFVQFDIKAISPELHRRLTSLDNARILDNAIQLLQSDLELLVRYPLVPGCNDDEAELDALGGFCSHNRRDVSVELLPYHSMGAGRYAALGRTYALPDTKPPTAAEMERAADILRRHPLNVIYR
ncbi:glycyl-radical enzyme activating protein [Synergistaceae bacterium OttesenSCG-928-I11]|nr:glycyl-radical enzyme activating protein [Synergistaceae bacterium OttesenSCG-928-I11]